MQILLLSAVCICVCLCVCVYVCVGARACSLTRSFNFTSLSCFFRRKFDSLTLETETDQKDSKNVDDNQNRAASENLSETDVKLKKCNVNQTSSDSPANPSVDSSTDTLIPNNDSVVPAINDEKEV